MDTKQSEQSDSVPASLRAQEVDSAASGSGAYTQSSYERLQQTTEKAVKRLTSKTKILPYIKEHFRADYKADSKYVLGVYKSMMDQLETMIKDELQLQLDASEVEQLLSDLDKTVKENPSTDKTWRPSGKPEEDIKAHLQKSSLEEVQLLQKILYHLESQNKLLNEHVARTDQKLEQSIKTIQTHHQAWEKAASMMTEETRQALIDSDNVLIRGGK